MTAVEVVVSLWGILTGTSIGTAIVLYQRLHKAQKRIAWYDASTKELQRRYVDAEERAEDAEDEVRHYREALKVANIHSAALEADKEQQP